MDRCMDGWVRGQLDGKKIDGCMDGWIYKKMTDEWMDGWKEDEWIDGLIEDRLIGKFKVTCEDYYQCIRLIQDNHVIINK